MQKIFLLKTQTTLVHFSLFPTSLFTSPSHMIPPSPSLSATILKHRLHHLRTFIDARVKWARDPFLDTAVSKEKNLKQLISLKNQILSSSLPLSTLSSSPVKFFQKYPSFFRIFQPCPSLPLHIKLTSQALTLHKEESAIHSSPCHRNDAVKRLAKVLMLANARRLPLHVVNKFKYDLGLPHNYVTALLADYPEYFQVCEIKDHVTNKETLALELVSWRKELAVSEMERKVCNGDISNLRRGRCIEFPMNFPRGFDLEKKVKNWVEKWQQLPYVSPYEDAFHLAPRSDLAEKWAVAVLHELLWLLVSKKTERDNVFCLGDYLGFGDRFKKVSVHHPGIFYVSNKIRTQTVVLREAYRKDFLVQKHALMGMRYRYVHLMNKSKDRRKPVCALAFGSTKKKKVNLSTVKEKTTKEDDNCGSEEEEDSNGSSESEFEDVDSQEQ